MEHARPWAGGPFSRRHRLTNGRPALDCGGVLWGQTPARKQKGATRDMVAVGEPNRVAGPSRPPEGGKVWKAGPVEDPAAGGHDGYLVRDGASKPVWPRTGPSRRTLFVLLPVVVPLRRAEQGARRAPEPLDARRQSALAREGLAMNAQHPHAGSHALANAHGEPGRCIVISHLRASPGSRAKAGSIVHTSYRCAPRSPPSSIQPTYISIDHSPSPPPPPQPSPPPSPSPSTLTSAPLVAVG